MYISRFQVGNYKSFRESTALEFTPGFNIISGQNNSGKTALLEAMGLHFASKPHRSIRTVPAKDRIPDPTSWADVSFTLSTSELKELMLSTGADTYQVMQPDPGSAFAQRVGFRDDSPESARSLVNAIFSQESLTFSLRVAGQDHWTAPSQPAYGLYTGFRPMGAARLSGFRIGRDGTLAPTGQTFQGGTDFGAQLGPVFGRHVYRFEAERMNLGMGAHGAGTVLNRNASNLPECLSQLQHNAARYRELNRQLSSILPQVKWVSVRGASSSQDEIVVWCHDPESQREDLAVPLLESGTGIAQVLAILYVVTTSDRPQAIIIDEPQSFLHPGAARKLIDVLRQFPQHQFIIATHSATIIAAANPTTVTLARFEDSETVLQQLDASKERGIQTTLADLGVRLSDLYGADNVLWVEGRTEEKCFPVVVEKLLKRPLMGTQILGIRQTGDLEGRDAKRVFEIYRSLTRGATLLPPAIAFILDQECRSDAAKRELHSLSGDRVQFVPRRMYENYLLNSQGIAGIANSIQDFRAPALTTEEVRGAIDLRLDDPDYYCERSVPAAPAERLARVDAARVLEEIFARFSEARVPYEKLRHGLAITEWLVEHSPEDLQEIAQLLSQILASRQPA